MTDYEIYIFVVCLIVFVLLTGLSAICLAAITRLYKRLIRCGEEDEKLIKENDRLSVGYGKAGDIAATVFNILICAVFVLALGFSIYINTQDMSVSDTVPTMRVVKSDSMSEKYSANTYLFDNDLNDQFDTFDIVYTYKMPDEYELELYDVVVYELKGELIIHRIIAIEEPDDEHPDGRLFTLRGDANQYSDTYKVEYSQMKGIYRGERIRFVGSFVLFMQSPAGWLCVLLMVAVAIGLPILENNIGKSKYRRLVEIGQINDYELYLEIEKERLEKGGRVAAPTAPYLTGNSAAAGNVGAAEGKRKGKAKNTPAANNGFYDPVEVIKTDRPTDNGFYDMVELRGDGAYTPTDKSDEGGKKE
ncbi:MAG: hypothetical protein LUD27_08720 [Clostridia bacterium]|nr:hypothetical protein [Clostridia bacterium]